MMTSSFSHEHSNCPVCHKGGVDYRKSDSCPQCESDLTIFQLLDKNESEKQERNDQKLFPSEINLKLAHETGKSYIKWIMIPILSIAFCIIVMMFFYFQQQKKFNQKFHDDLMMLAKQNNSFSPNVMAIQTTLESLNEKTLSLESQIKKIEKHNTDLTQEFKDGLEKIVGRTSKIQEKSSSIIQHIFGAKDNLWSVAKNYWGRGDLYPYLLEYNPNLNLGQTIPGNVLMIGPFPLNEFPKEYITRKRGRRYYHYLVRQKLSLNSLSQQLYGDDKKMNHLLRSANKKKQAMPNQRILIPLPY